MTRLETTTKVQKLRLSFTDDKISKEIGISRNTLYKRIKNHDWKKSEIFLISQIGI